MKYLKASLLGLVAASMATAAAAQDRSARRASAPDMRLYLTSGLSYTQRDEADEPTTHYYRIPIAARLTRGPFRLTASIPYLIVDGPGSNLGDDDDPGNEVPEDAADEDRRGFGDLSITGRYRLPRADLGGFELDLMGRVKLPTASRDKRLGTGEIDYAMGAELSRRMGKIEPFVSAQYRINGDRPDRDYRNTVATSLGANIRVARGTRASLAWDYTQSRIRGREGSHMLDAGLTQQLARGLTLGGDAAVGLSKNAPDFRVGMTLTKRAF